MYTIIEDCSPYYIRFTHPGIENVINQCNAFTNGVDFVNWPTANNGFTHYVHSKDESDALLATVPMASKLKLNPDRVSSFVTQPGRYYRAHKDGIDNRVSINYTVKILDQSCVTSWYSDEDLNGYLIEGDNWSKKSRECVGFDKSLFTPLKSMTAIEGECILFNTDIFHDFDNRTATHERIVLTLRLINPGTQYFDDIKKILFGNNC